MNIRNRLFLSYVLLVVLVIIYGGILLTFRNIQHSIDHDMEDLYASKDVWNDMLISLNEMQLNWADGETYENFKGKYQNLDQRLLEMSSGGQRHLLVNLLGSSEHLQMRKSDLYQTWLFARESVLLISGTVETDEFRQAVKPLEKQPGLQRLNHLWSEQYYSGEPEARKDAYIIRLVLDQIEFFPIYSETLNHLFSVIIDETEQMIRKIEQFQVVVTTLFFLLFLLVYMVFAIRFSKSLSRPIITLSMRLSSFIGRTLKMERNSHDDELKLLEQSVISLMDHYTYLAELAGRLAEGEIDSPILALPKQGVVGDALKDINRYLSELAQTSQWIREGNYGAAIRVKSDKDILAKNFNVMSEVIRDKISTLRNIFEAVDEGIVAADESGRIIEANSNFLQLTGLEGIDWKTLKAYRLQSFLKKADLTHAEMHKEGGHKVVYSEIVDLEGKVSPVKILSSVVPGGPGKKNQQMYFITNESLRVRMERERESLRAHAVEAELRALRAQINPHFLFNTLNSIAHLIESGREGAVKMIEELADLFRYSLSSTRRNRVPISEELMMIRQYLNIEKIRFGEKLQAQIIADAADTHVSIPPMLLQPIVENAVKYGADRNGLITIIIRVERKGSERLITIQDFGTQVVDSSLLLSQKGTGIRNVNQRLQTIYDQGLVFSQNEPQGLSVSMTIRGEE